MKLSGEQLVSLAEAALNAAQKAADFIREKAKSEFKVEIKSGGASLASQVVTEVDRLSQKIILTELQSTFTQYDLGLLTEESEDDKSRLSKDYFWCIDPLDGTLSFTEGKEGYSVSIALVSKDGVPHIGVVVDPVNQITYYVIRGIGVFKNGTRVELNSGKEDKNSFFLIYDRTFKNSPDFDTKVSQFKAGILQLGYSNFTMLEGGGAVLNACSVIEKSSSCYFKFPKKNLGGGCFWDYASTVCLFEELGLYACDFNGNMLKLNREETIFMNEFGVIFCNDQIVLNLILNLYKS